MYKDELNAVCNASISKSNLINNNILGYFVSSMLAGIYVGLGILLIFSIGGLLGDFKGTKIIMGISFGIALSSVIIAGAELFTGNNLIMTIGVLNKKTSFTNLIKVWIVSYIGNLIGAVLVSVLFYLTGLAGGDIGSFIANTSLTKMTLSPEALLFRGILCNTLVCLAVWCSFRCKSDSGKLIMIFWCLFAFITSGYEHSIANMTIMAVGLLTNSEPNLTIYGYFYNLLFVTIGNIIGGVFLIALPYHMIAKN
ncbi:formate/nitrite transporter family protein [Brachyspira murdochii]|uniref:Nitrite transporter NirC n=1 Tax=Brachyspira murdochii TaxID=84378 RepID=A0ABX5B522_9SPIR|nr:formate/nitrite transporter family protein [Brachyspira murdochii]PPS21412.1 nitrite transporter NirC [Brachyspira murdochii]